MLTVKQYATQLGISRQAVLQKIRLGKLPAGVTAEKFGPIYLIKIAN